MEGFWGLYNVIYIAIAKMRGIVRILKTGKSRDRCSLDNLSNYFFTRLCIFHNKREIRNVEIEWDGMEERAGKEGG